MSTIRLDIVSAEKAIYTGQVKELIVTGIQGELGVRPGHAPLLTQLRPGQVQAHMEDGEVEFFYISGGMLEVQPDCVTVLADSADYARDLDEKEVLEAQRRAKEAVENRDAGVEYSEALSELAKAAAQAHLIQKLRNLR